MTKNIYRVVAISRTDGSRVVCHESDRATLATDTFIELTERRPAFFADFKIVLERLEPVVVMESE